jgi:hypothetical protein
VLDRPAKGEGLRIRPMGMVMGLEEDWPAEGCHSSCVGRTERVPLSFLYEASTEGVEAVMAALCSLFVRRQPRIGGFYVDICRSAAHQFTQPGNVL